MSAILNALCWDAAAPGWKAQPNFQIQVLDSLFCRNKAAYIVGRVVNGDIRQPLHRTHPAER